MQTEVSLLRPELPELPETMKTLPVHRGYPVPWFVHWINGEPEFRVIGPTKIKDAIRKHLCWVCGQPFTNRRRAFVIGPMCAVNRISAEPPCHISCATFSAKGCPFLTRPNMVRRENDLPDDVHQSEAHIARNPGVMLVWHCKSWNLYRDGDGVLFEVGDPINWEWYREGRAATRAEIIESIESGIPKVMDMAAESSDEIEFRERVEWVIKNMVPRQ